jgi:hypothetical protein
MVHATSRPSEKKVASIVVFEGFTEADFDAYLAARASSNTFNRPRIEARLKAVSLARQLQERAAAAGLALETHASDAAPSLWNKRHVTAQWAFLWRDHEARRRLEEVLDKGRTLSATLSDPTPYFRHAFIALFLDAERVDVSLKVHGDAWVDVRNLRARCNDDAACAVLVEALHALPEGYVMGVTGGATIAARATDAVLLRDTLASLHESAQWWFVGRELPRADAVSMGAALGLWIEETFTALMPVYRLVAWSHDNDLVSIEAEVATARAERLAHVDEEAAREAEWKARHDAEIERRRAEASVETRERVAGSERPRAFIVHEIAHSAPPPEPRRESKPAPARESKPPREARAPQPRIHVAPRVEVTTTTVAAGARVQIKDGPFAGRVGTVAEVDNRGHARVMFGLIAARFETTVLAVVTTE